MSSGTHCSTLDASWATLQKRKRTSLRLTRVGEPRMAAGTPHPRPASLNLVPSPSCSRAATGPLRIRRLLHATASVATYILLAVLTVPWLALHIVGWMCIALRRPARRAGVIRSRRQWTTSSHPVPTDSRYRELVRSCSNASFAFLNQASRVALEPLAPTRQGSARHLPVISLFGQFYFPVRGNLFPCYAQKISLLFVL